MSEGLWDNQSRIWRCKIYNKKSNIYGTKHAKKGCKEAISCLSIYLGSENKRKIIRVFPKEFENYSIRANLKICSKRVV